MRESSEEPNVRLDSFDQEEWWEVARILAPSMTREAFDLAWYEFQELKRKKALQ